MLRINSWSRNWTNQPVVKLTKKLFFEASKSIIPVPRGWQLVGGLLSHQGRSWYCPLLSVKLDLDLLLCN